MKSDEDEKNNGENEEQKEESNSYEENNKNSCKIEFNQNENSEEEDIEEQQNSLKIEDNKTTRNYNLDGIEVQAFIYENKENMNIIFHKDSSTPRLILHWGIFKDYPIKEWYHPSTDKYPMNTKEYDGWALDTEFVNEDNEDRESKIEIEIPKNSGLGISFAFYNPDSQKWHNNNSKDFQINFIH